MYSSYTPAIRRQLQFRLINERHAFFVYSLLRVLLSGSNANTQERKVAMKVAQDFIKEKNYSSKTQVHCLHVPKHSTEQNIRFIHFPNPYFLLKEIILHIFTTSPLFISF